MRLNRLVGVLELLLALAIAVLAGPEVIKTLFSAEAAATEWSSLVTFVFVPIAIAFAVAGLALLRGWRWAWWYQVIPALTMIDLTVYLWTV